MYVCMTLYVCIVCMDVFLSLIAYPSIQLLSLQVCFNKFSSVIDWKSWPLRYRKQSAPDDIVSRDLDWHPAVHARRAVICISDLHQNDTRIGCLVAWQTTDHWAHATGPWPGCDMTHHDFSYKEGNAVCVQLAPSHSYAPLASASSSPGCQGRWNLSGRRSQHLSSTPNASILVVLCRSWAGPSPAWLHPTISRYCDTLAYDIVIQFFSRYEP